MTTPTVTERLLGGHRTAGGTRLLRDHVAWFGAAPRLGASLIDLVTRAGLTGRGGGAFPTARKLGTVAAAGTPGVVLVNACEGEPLSAKDRVLLTYVPHLVLDGAELAAAAIGGREIIVCAHAGSRPVIERAVAERTRTDAPVRVATIPGRYVASEETALVAALNGGRAVPTATPPRPFERGVRGLPTLVANAETYAHLALIARYGPDWFRSAGTADAPGTALFTVGGAVRAPGVVEAPFGTPLAHLLDLAGGPDAPVQAVLTGGYGGAWLPAARLDTPATPTDLRAAGGAMGPGIVAVLPAGSCGVMETARILAWLAEESAGQCGPCAFGLPAIAGDFARLAEGTTGPATLRRLRERLGVIPGRGACRHPDGAVRLAASALEVFGPHLATYEHPGRCRGLAPSPVRSSA